MTKRYFIKQAISLGLWNSLDIQFANMLVTTVFPNDNNYDTMEPFVLMIASACLSSKIRAGHTCLPISLLSNDIMLQNLLSKFTNQTIQDIKQLKTDDWKDVLHSTNAIGNGSNTLPLVIDNNCLYLHRIWRDECSVAKFLVYSNSDISVVQKKKITNILNTLFSINSIETNWQKIAIAISLIHPRVFISGGPGTGKTSIISKIITALLLYNKESRIQTTATTGKSSVILDQSCRNVIKELKKINNLQSYKIIPQTVTVHSLLGARLYQKKSQYNFFKNILNLDCLIIDESSMISLSILSNLISVLSIQTKIIFLGDHHQLYSIESGSVFQEVCQFSNYNYSLKQQQELQKLTNDMSIIIDDSKRQDNDCNNIIDKICVLKKNYRFHFNSGIGQLSKSIKLGDYNKSLSILTSAKYQDLKYFQINKQQDYISMIIDCSKKYYKYLQTLKYDPRSIINILKQFNEYRILCALKQGPFGTIQLNYYIEQILNQEGLITLNQSKNYIGRPIIILRNDTSLGLCNGDVGILLPNFQNSLSAYFEIPADTIKTVEIYQLPLHETCFAMTIHKSQGSSFQKISVILPNQNLPILNRELIYTAVTRARQQLCLYARQNILTCSIQNLTIRYSGLYDKIKKYSKIQSNT